jgi:hypothetical protein
LALAAVSEAEISDPQADFAGFDSVSPRGDGRTSFDEQVGRLDIAMHDTELMSMFQRKCGLHPQNRSRAEMRGCYGMSRSGLQRCGGMSIARIRSEA